MPETQKFAGGSGDSSSDNSLQANSVVHRRYKILGILGQGGMGAVYQARDLNFPDVHKLVAIKEMLNPATDPAIHNSTLKLFQREANILATLNHPAIPKIFDFFDQNERFYLVMELIVGSDLEELINKTKELPVDKVIDWAIELCDVLEYLHTSQSKPIIFRDLKPSNIMIDNFGKVRLIDFGIAKIFDSDVRRHTMIGTEGYCAPEQYKGNVTTLSDIYGLGATLHHVLTRKDPRLEPPFSFGERPIREFNTNVPERFVEAIERALSLEPDKRFNSASEMKADLERLRYQPQVAFGAVAEVNDGTNFFDGLDADGAIQPKWKYPTEDEIRASASIYKEMVFVASYDTNVYGVNLADGEFAWKYATHGGIAASPIVDESNRLVLFGSEDKTFYALDCRNGRISWSYTTQDKIRSTARIAPDVDAVFFGSDDGHLHALNVLNGRFLWKHDMGDPIRSRPFIFNDLVIVGAESGEMVALELSGNRKWGFRARRSLTSSPYVDTIEGICYVGSTDGYMYALDASSGYSSWRFRTNGPIISSPVVHEGLLYFGSADGYLYAINAQTSREKWKFQTEKAILSSPVVHNGAVYFGGIDEYFYCVDIQTGKERWKFKTNGAITSTACIANDVILIGSLDKTLYALPLVG
ncbi:MAG: serine/threonine-protein kinase [Anaerolineaceae bacterium]|nr:serine/threonine-protein kinase [Anaerolineaceae bacterium]